MKYGTIMAQRRIGPLSFRRLKKESGSHNLRWRENLYMDYFYFYFFYRHVLAAS